MTRDVWTTIIIVVFIVLYVAIEIVDSIMVGKSEERRQNYLQGLNNDSGIIDKKKARKDFKRSNKKK